AAAYPDRPVKIVVPFAPGGTSDIVARLLAAALSQSLGQSVFVENRAGANGNIGIAAAAKADPDGYTLLVASSVIVVNPTLSKQATYDPARDFSPIADLGSSPNVIVTRPDTGIRDVADLIARARANPDQLNFSSPGLGSISQLGAELLKLRADIRMVHVPFTGAGPAAQAVLAGTTQLAAVNIGTVIQLIKAGSLKALVQTGKVRWFDLPDVPTLAEAGVPNAASETFQALLAPAGTPKEIVDRLAKETTEILQRPDVREKLRSSGFNPVGSGPEALQARVAEEVAMWREVIARTGLKVE
ncbi:MAG TPA: tripartite tricarboxylate transporter substrate binding protein, partial [Xanthobacteraceae bacterium]|nr:tripartite tricarboxylate transporter substrate binding protein [Xanthobacteraceae bacterium]